MFAKLLVRSSIERVPAMPRAVLTLVSPQMRVPGVGTRRRGQSVPRVLALAQPGLTIIPLVLSRPL